MKNNIKKLVDILHQSSEETRLTVYWGVGYGIVTISLVNKDVTLSDIKIIIKDIVDSIAELAIIDRVVLEKAIINLYKYFNLGKSDTNYASAVFTAANMEGVLFINEFIGKSTIDIINKNIELFKDAFNAVYLNRDIIKTYSPLLKD